MSARLSVGGNDGKLVTPGNGLQRERGGRGTIAIAFHLPQYYPTPENDEWWGKGFTEWTNVVKAYPLFPGHYQPHLPADLGFYDLRLREARESQAELAAEYGVYGFCYYHYWFSGRRILERPVNEIVACGEPDFPFCLCWANHNWTRRWDGLENEMLLKQEYSAEDDLAHIRALIPLFRDPRYIRVCGRPFFAVYLASHLPDARRTTDIWRREAERAGLNGLFLVRVESCEQSGDPTAAGFDCGLQFEPHGALARLKWYKRIVRRKWWHRHKIGTGEAVFRDNEFYYYEDMVRQSLAEADPGYLRIPCVSPGWDNTARKRKNASVFLESTPELYEHWLSEVVKRQKSRAAATMQAEITAEDIVFINAWNEWGEGNHLEPCQRWGRAYLEATRRALGWKVGDASLSSVVEARSGT